MHSIFWDNVREQIKNKKDGQKWLSGESGVGRTAINNGISKLSSPSVDNAYAVSRALETTIEELVGGEAGAEYVRGIIRNDPRAIQVPDRIKALVEGLLLLSDDELAGIRANVAALAEIKKGELEKAG